MHYNDSFLTKIQDVLKQNLSDPDFGIADFCTALNISRTHLHRKITQLTGLSTSCYIRQLRLEAAKDLLVSTDLLVYEVADQVGFRDVTYFSSSFSDFFGYPPKTLKSQKTS